MVYLEVHKTILVMHPLFSFITVFSASVQHKWSMSNIDIWHQISPKGRSVGYFLSYLMFTYCATKRRRGIFFSPDRYPHKTGWRTRVTVETLHFKIIGIILMERAKKAKTERYKNWVKTTDMNRRVFTWLRVPVLCQSLFPHG